jgi:phospho-2-dehydro-3-deoxyheptonate aldolase
VGLEARTALAVWLIHRPCSVHDPEQAITYAKKLHEYAQEAKEDLMIVMRVYFEKYVYIFAPPKQADG